MALPIPSLAPVTIAFFPVIAKSIALSPLASRRIEPRDQFARIIIQDFRDIHVAKPALRTVPTGSRSAGGNE